MRPRTLLVLFALVVGLGAFIWFYERKLPSSEERAELAKKVLRFEKEEVQAVAVERGGRELRLERMEAKPAAEEKEKDGDGEENPDVLTPGDTTEDHGEWRIAKPLAARADASMVASLLDSLAGIEKTRTIEDPDLKALGLDKPQATVRLTTEDGEKVLKLGAKMPTGAAVAAAIEGEPAAYVVSDAVLATLDREPGEWRDRQVFHGKRGDVERIALNGENGRVVLVRRDGGFWLESPVADRADNDLVETLLSDVTGLSAQTFLDDPGKSPAELGLAPPQGSVVVTTKGAEPLRIELGAPVVAAAEPASAVDESFSPARYARAGGLLFETQTGLGEALARLPADWRSRALTGFEVYQVQSLRVKDGKGEVALTRVDTDWKRGEETISYTPVSDLLFAVTGTRAERLLAPAEAQALGAVLAQPALTLVLKGETGEETLTLYPAVAEGVPARVTGRDAVLLLPGTILEDLRKQVAAVRNAKPVAPSGEGEDKDDQPEE